MSQVISALSTNLSVGYRIMNAVVKDYTVLQSRPPKYLCSLAAAAVTSCEVASSFIDRTGEEITTRTENEFSRDDWIFDSSVGA